MGYLERDSVMRVRAALTDAGLADTVVELDDTARSAEEAAAALGVHQGAIVKSLVFSVGGKYVLVLVSGDKRCNEAMLPRVFNLEGPVLRPSAEQVRAVTGFSIGGVAPAGMPKKLPCAIDGALKGYGKVYAAAGHTHCVFATDWQDLKKLTGGVISYAVSSDRALEPAYN